MSICKKCPLYNDNKVLGPICSPLLFVHPETGDISTKYKKDYIRGCGCRLNAKSRLNDAKCPLGKW